MSAFSVYIKKFKKVAYTHRLLVSSFIFFFLFSAVIRIVSASYSPGETLDPTCAPGDVGCSVSIPIYLPDQTDFVGSLFVGDGGQNLVYTSGDDGRYNMYVGIGSGASAIDADSTTAVGYQSLYSQQSGNANTALGYQSMYNQVDGFGNVGIGYQTLYTGVSSGGGNVAIGYGAMYANTSGYDNVGIGRFTLEDNTTGGQNVGVGFNALPNNTTGSNNIGLGLNSLLANTTGAVNLALGSQAGRSNTTGDRNIYIGRFSGFNMTTGTYNTIIGNNADITGNGITTGSYNTIIGGQITGLSSTLSNVVLIADGTGARVFYRPNQTDFTGTIITGDSGASLSHTSGADGRYNTFTGIGAGHTNSIGAYNNFIGYQAGYLNDSGLYNNFIGYQAGFNNLDSDNNFMGYQAGYNNTYGFQNVFVGDSAGYDNTSGTNNTFIGAYSGSDVISGGSNTFIGENTGGGITTGGKNTIIGASIGSLSSTLSNTVIIADGDGNKRLYINSSGQAGISCTDPDHVLEIGGTGTGCNTGAGSYLNAAGDTAFTANSSRIWKENIATVAVDDILTRIMNTPVRRYDWKEEYCDGPACLNKIGFIAEEFYPVLEHGDDKHINGQDVAMAEWLGLQKLIEVTSALDLKIQGLSSLDTTNSNSLGSLIKTFLADAGNTIQNIFTNRITTKEICVDESTCLNEQDIRNLINEAHGSASSIIPILEPTPEIPETQEIGTEVIPEPTVSPDLIPEETPIEEEVNEIVL
jgi:hypothetical protein